MDATLGNTQDTALVASVRKQLPRHLGHAAEGRGEHPFVRLGADVNAATRAGWTPLKEAENQHCPAITAELRKAGATR